MDRNSVIGFILLGALLVAYVVFNHRSEEVAMREKARQDSIALVNQPKSAATSAAAATTAGTPDSARLASQFGTFATAAAGNEQTTILENDVVKIIFTNKGGDAQSVQLKQFKTYDGGPLMLQEGSLNRISLQLPANGNTLNTADLYFTPSATGTPAEQPVSSHADHKSPRDRSATSMTGHEAASKGGQAPWAW